MFWTCRSEKPPNLLKPAKIVPNENLVWFRLSFLFQLLDSLSPGILKGESGNVLSFETS